MRTKKADRGKLTEAERAELAELRRCFQFLCDKFHWLLEFKRISLRKADYLRPEEGPEGMLELAKHLSSFDEDVLETQVHYIEDDGRAHDIVAIISSTPDELRDYLKEFKGIDDVARFMEGYALKVRAEVEDGAWDREMLFSLRALKDQLTTPESMVVNMCMVDLDEPRLDGKRYAKVLSGPLPKFASMEELKLKLEVHDVRMLTIYGNDIVEEMNDGKLHHR